MIKLQLRFGVLACALFAMGACGGSTEPKTVPPAAVATVSLPQTVSVIEHTPTRLIAVPKAADGTELKGRVVTWSSGSPTIATVSDSGIVTTLKRGTTTITATIEGRTATSTITVIQSPVCSLANAVPLTSGQTINGTITTSDCAFGAREADFDGTFFDVYKFVVTAATTIDIQMKSPVLDSYLFLYYAFGTDSAAYVAEDDDSGGGQNARLSGSITTAGTYYLLANNFEANILGAYTLSLVSPFVPALRADAMPAEVIQLKPVTGADAMSVKAVLLQRKPKHR